MPDNASSSNVPGVKREIVIAPPGCGKTEELARRLLEAIISDKCHPDRRPKKILCITFTKNAARVMIQRVQKKLHKGNSLPDSIQIATLHSYCWSKLQEEVKGKVPRLCVIDNGDIGEFSRSSGLDDFNQINDYQWKESPEIRMEQVIRAASYVKQGKDIPFNPRRSEAWQAKFKEFTQKYIQFKDDLNRQDERLSYLDFYDILLEADKRIGKGKWTERFDIVLVDEVQDLSNFQLDIIERLVSDNGSICFFGDPEQAIYSFMGANVSKLHKLWLSCDESNRYSLRVNKRSPAYLVKLFNKYARNRIRIDKRWPGFNMEWEQIPAENNKNKKKKEESDRLLERLIKYNKDLDENIALYHASSFEQEIWKICTLIDSFDPGEKNAILALHNQKVDEVITLLKKKRKYVIRGASDQEHTYLPRLMRAHILACSHPGGGAGNRSKERLSLDEEDSWASIIPFLVKGKGKRWALGVIRRLKQLGSSPLDVMEGRVPSTIQEEPPKEREDMHVLISALRRYGPLYLDCSSRLERLKGCPEETLNARLCDWMAYCHKHLVEFGLLVPYQIRQWNIILGLIKAKFKHTRVHGFEEHLHLIDDLLSRVDPEDVIPSYGPDRRIVSVMTVHKAKGLDFDNVFLCSSNQTWDFSQSSEHDRVFFVGMTRAKKRLVFSYSDPAPTAEDIHLGRKPKSKLKDFSFIQDPKEETDNKDTF